MDHDDLTSSRWDDVVSPSSQYGFASAFGDPPLTGFGALAVNDSEHSEQEDEPEQDENDENDDQQDEHNDEHDDTAPVAHGYTPFAGSAVDTARLQMEQLQELKREERNEHKSQLMSELARGDDFDSRLEQSFVSPQSSGALFEHDGPVKANFDGNLTVKPAKVKNSKLYRPRKFSAKQNAKHLNKGTEPDLGPLAFDKASENVSDHSDAKQDLVKEAAQPLYEIRQPPPAVPEPKADAVVKTPLDDGPKNDLDIVVSDPMKVGDITNAHIIYTITTKNKSPGTGNFPNSDAPFTVTRRYKDFRWIYHQLQNNHLGKIIPPPPTKQTYLGRFNESFIENRRLSLEKMLSKISNIGSLSSDDDFIMFLTSDDFANESKERERISGSGASLQNNDSLDNASDVSTVDVGAQSSNGFMSNFFSMAPKVIEPDEYFTDKRSYIEGLESNLRNFYKSIDLIITQRVDMVALIEEMTSSIDDLANLEISKNTTDLLLAFNDVQTKLKDNLDRVNLQDHLTLGFTIEEYLRIIGSIKFVLDKRVKIYQQYQTHNQDLIKKRASLNKLGNRNVEKFNQLNFEIDKLTQRTAVFEKKFNTISDTIKHELEVFEMGKIDDFRNSVEIFIESSIESQKESIELWETFYERQQLAKY